MRRLPVVHIPLIATLCMAASACEPDSVTGPGAGYQVVPWDDGGDPDPAFSSGEVPASPGWNDPGPMPEDGSCATDLDCMIDEACGGTGCDEDPCADDRCVSGKCQDLAIEACIPGYAIEYSYAACCATRTIRIAADGGCTFEVAGIGSRRCEYLDPAYVRQVVDHASAVGFFGWDRGACVPGESGADFSIGLADGTDDSTISCADGVCTGPLCHIIDRIWAAMPPHWQDGCGC